MFNSLLSAVAVVATASTLSAQVSLDEYLRTAPTNAETVNQTELLTKWSPLGGGLDDVWVLTPEGTTFKTTVGQLPSFIASNGSLGLYALYINPRTSAAIRHDVFVK